MSDRKSNKRESGMSSQKSFDESEKTKESADSVKESSPDRDRLAYEARREERRRSMEEYLKETMASIDWYI